MAFSSYREKKRAKRRVPQGRFSIRRSVFYADISAKPRLLYFYLQDNLTGTGYCIKNNKEIGAFLKVDHRLVNSYLTELESHKLIFVDYRFGPPSSKKPRNRRIFLLELDKRKWKP